MEPGRTPFPTVWWRHSAYELVRGNVQPINGASLTIYDPRAAYEQARADRRQKTGVQTAWESFVNLTTEDEAVEWCNRNGSVGLLPLKQLLPPPAPWWEIWAVSSAPQLSDGGMAIDEDAEEEDLTAEAVARLFFPAAKEWRYPDVEPYPSWSAEHPGWADYKRIPKNWHPQTAAYLERLDRCISVLQPHEGAWNRYFPKGPTVQGNDAAYPPPLSPAFWQFYTEPVSEILAAAELLKRTILAVQGKRPARSAALEVVDWILASSRLTYRESKVGRGLHLRGIPCSLLSAMVQMAVDDVAGAARLRECDRKGCGSLFVSTAYQARYCSPTCQNREKIRQWRKALKDPVKRAAYEARKRKRQEHEAKAVGRERQIGVRGKR